MIADALERGVWLSNLIVKAASEIRNVSQFSDPRRRAELIQNGLIYLRPIIEGRRLQITEEDINKSLLVLSEPTGLVLASSPDIPIAAVIFPLDTKIFYNNPHRPDFRKDAANAYISAMAYDEGVVKPGVFSSEGYKDSSRETVPFVQKPPEQTSFNGGILVDNQTGKLKVLNYQQLQEEATRDLSQPEVLMAANWYMDNQVYRKIAHRKEMRFPVSNNCIGIFKRGEEERVFTLNNYWDSIKAIQFRISGNFEGKSYCVKAIDFATIANVLSYKLGYDNWALGGVEFTGGGTYFFNKFAQRDSFAAYF